MACMSNGRRAIESTSEYSVRLGIGAVSLDPHRDRFPEAEPFDLLHNRSRRRHNVKHL